MILNILKWIVVAVVFLGTVLAAVYILAAKALDMEMEFEEEMLKDELLEVIDG